MALTNIDLFNSLVLVLMFNAGLLFMVLGFFVKWPKNALFLEVAAIFLWMVSVIIPASPTQFYPAGWASFILAMTSFFFGMIYGVAGFYYVYSGSKEEEWEKEEVYFAE